MIRNGILGFAPQLNRLAAILSRKALGFINSKVAAMFDRIFSFFGRTHSGPSRKSDISVVAVQVDEHFAKTQIQSGECMWVDEADVKLYERDGYAFYEHTENGKWCCRIARPGPRPAIEFLMTAPAAPRVTIDDAALESRTLETR